MAQKHFYFAYGDSVNLARLKKWLFQRGGRPDEITTAQHAVLSGWKLVFNVHKDIPWKAGVANVAEDKKGEVEGVLLEVANALFNHIQKKEGYPASSKSVEVTVVGDKEKTYDKVTMFVSTRADEGKTHAPTKDYIGHLLAGAKDFEFSDKYVKSLEKVKTAD